MRPADIGVSSPRAQDVINVHNLVEVFQGVAAESLHMIAIAQAADGLWTDQELTGLRQWRPDAPPGWSPGHSP